MSSYSQSDTKGLQSLKMAAQHFVGDHPVRAAVILAVLVVLVVVLLFLNARKTGEKFQNSAPPPGAAPAPAPPPGSPCDPGEVLVTYTDSDGNKQAYCKQEGSLPGPGTVCQDSAWTPDATAEAQALATVGSLQHDDYGERPLQRAIDGAYDADAGLADEDLAALMHQGGTP